MDYRCYEETYLTFPGVVVVVAVLYAVSQSRK